MPQPAGVIHARQFGRYRLFERIAHGGMAEIYRAELVGAGGVTRQLVVKKILPEFADDRAFVEMFTDEARIAMALTHGNIAQVYDFGEVEGEYFLAMEHVVGKAVSELVDRLKPEGRVVPAPIAALIARELCAGLHYAHTRRGPDGQPLGIVHRDISPENVLLSYEGAVKIVDFGLAKAKIQQSLSEPGQLKGKYVYFAPEQARGGTIDARTDVYAVGVVLYEMVTGRLPVEGSLPDVLKRIQAGDFPPPSAFADVPGVLEAIILKAMAHDPGERPRSARALGDELSRWLAEAEPDLHGEWAGWFLQSVFGEEARDTTGRDPTLPGEFTERLAGWERAHRTAFGLAESGGGTLVAPELAAHVRRAAAEAQARERGGGWPRAALFALGVALAVGLGAGLLLARSMGAPEAPVPPPPPATPIALPPAPAARADQPAEPAPAAEPKPAPPQAEASADAAAAERAAEAEAELEARPGPDYRATVDFTRDVLAVPANRSVRHKLEPTHRYKVTLKGDIDLGPMKRVLALHKLWYYAHGPAGGQAGFVAFDAPLRITGAAEIFFFLVDMVPEDNDGSFQIHVQDLAGGPSARLTFDGRDAVTSMRLGAIVRYDPQSAGQGLVLECRGTLGPGGAGKIGVYFDPTFPMLMSGQPVGDAMSRLVEVGERVRPPPGALVAHFFMLDDDLADNAGKCDVRVAGPQE